MAMAMRPEVCIGIHTLHVPREQARGVAPEVLSQSGMTSPGDADDGDLDAEDGDGGGGDGGGGGDVDVEDGDGGGGVGRHIIGSVRSSLRLDIDIENLYWYEY